MKRPVIGVCLRPEFWLWLLSAWLTVSAIRSLNTPWERAALTEWLRWGAGIGLALVLGRWLTQTRLAVRLLTGFTGLIAVLGIWDGIDAAHGGMIGPFRDHQLCGSTLLVLIPICLAASLTTRGPQWRWVLQGVVLAGIICLMATETRSAWIGAGVSGLTFAALWWHRVQSGMDRQEKRQALVTVMLVACIALAFGVVAGHTELQRSLSARADTLGLLGRDHSWQLRLSAWGGAEKMILARPLDGWGLGRYTDQQWRFTHQGRILSPTEHPSLSEQAHNLYLQTAAETGGTGLLLLVAFLATSVGKALSLLRCGRGQPLRSRDVHLIMMAAMIAGFAVDALASPSYQYPEVSLIVWAALGVGLSALNGRTPAQRQTVSLPIPMLRFSRMATSGALALLLLSQFVPLGLLAPVAAYVAEGYTYQVNNPPIIAPVAITAAPGDVVAYTMTAHYTDNSTGATQNVDVTLDSTTVFNASLNGFLVPGFAAGGSAKNVFTLPPTQANGQPWVNGTQISISGYFYDSALPAVRRNATPAILTIHTTSP